VFFDEHQTRLLQAVWLLVRNRQEAEEIAQDAFVRVWERWDTVTTHPNPEGYLYRTALNLARSRRRRFLVAVRKTPSEGVQGDLLLRVDSQDAVMHAVARLTPRQRAAVVLVDLVGLTSVEAAAALGTRPSTVRVLLARGRQTLRKEWHIDD
jgi:RNA polymerase sigma factor (sigma-70 family)